MSIDKAVNQAPMGLNDLMEPSESTMEIEIINPEGLTIGVDGVAVDLMPEEEDEGFDDNLAEYLDKGELQKIATDLLELVDADITSRKDWTEMYVKGLEVLG